MRGILAVVALTIAWPSPPAFASGQTAVQPLTVTRASGTTRATCTLIHREDRSDAVVLYFVTAGRLFTCEGINAGEIDVPLPLRHDEWVLDVAPALIHSEQVHLADIAVMRVGDRSVKLRFSVGGGSTSPWAIGCSQPQALVTLRVTLVSTDRE